MAPNAPMLNYLYWLRQRGQVFPQACAVVRPPLVEARTPIRFLVVVERDPALYTEDERLLMERMLSATGLPRHDFVFEPSATAGATAADASIEAILCLGSQALKAVAPLSFEEALNGLFHTTSRQQLVCAIHAAESMERDPSLKKVTWLQLQRFIAAVKKEPRA